MVQPVYLVITSAECDDVYCVCSTKEKAEEIVDKLFKKHKDSDPYEFTAARVVEYGIDEIPEELDGSV